MFKLRRGGQQLKHPSKRSLQEKAATAGATKKNTASKASSGRCGNGKNQRTPGNRCCRRRRCRATAAVQGVLLPA